jgi:hypothetical protein
MAEKVPRTIFEALSNLAKLFSFIYWPVAAVYLEYKTYKKYNALLFLPIVLFPSQNVSTAKVMVLLLQQQQQRS